MVTNVIRLPTFHLSFTLLSYSNITGRWQNTGDDICHVSGLVFSAVQQWTEQTNTMLRRNSAGGEDGGSASGVEREIDGTGAVRSVNNAAGRSANNAASTVLRLHRSSGDSYVDEYTNGTLVQIQVGDVLQFFNRSAGLLVAESKVVAIRDDPSTHKYGQQGRTVVTLDADFPPGLQLDLGVIGANIKSATNVFDLNATCSQFVFRNNAVSNGRRFGVLAKGQRLAIEDNTFVGLGSGAVQFDNAVTEGLCARSAVTARNTVLDISQLASHGQPPNFYPRGARCSLNAYHGLRRRRLPVLQPALLAGLQGQAPATNFSIVNIYPPPYTHAHTHVHTMYFAKGLLGEHRTVSSESSGGSTRPMPP
jgi:hypothetical protein